MSSEKFVVFPFGEGVTEKVIFDFLMRNSSFNGTFQPFQSVGGKKNFRHRILEFLQGQLQPGDDIRALVFRDVDDGEEKEKICQSFQDIIGALIPGFQTQPDLVSDTIYVWNYDADFRFRLVLHLARPPINGHLGLRNQTADGYILAIGLQEKVLSRFAGEIHSEPESIKTLIQHEIPSVIRNKEIGFDEDKDYLAAYLTAARFWKVKRTEEKARLARIILDRGWRYAEEETKEILRSWLKALEVTAQ